MLGNRNRPRDLDPTISTPKMSQGSKWVNNAIIIAFVIITLSLVRILTWGLETQPTLEVNNSPFPTRTIRDQPTAGGIVFLDADYCKHRDVEGNMRVSFLSDTREIFLPITKEASDPGCHKRELAIPIPVDIPAQQYIIKFRVTYQKNPIKKDEVIEFESRPILINPANT